MKYIYNFMSHTHWYFVLSCNLIVKMFNMYKRLYKNLFPWERKKDASPRSLRQIISDVQVLSKFTKNLTHVFLSLFSSFLPIIQYNPQHNIIQNSTHLFNIKAAFILLWKRIQPKVNETQQGIRTSIRTSLK